MAFAGGDELPELRRQTTDYIAKRLDSDLPSELLMLPGCNHFSILDELVSPEGRVTQGLTNLLRRLR